MAGNALSLTGTWMQRIACSWLVWDWTGSAFWLGILAAADLLPVVVTGPFAGVAADRWDRLRQNMLAQIASAFLAIGMAVLVAVNILNLSLLLLFVALQGIFSAAVQPARMAMVQQMVARKDMGVAVALNSVNVNLARLTGPAAAGAMIVQMDIIWVFILNALVTFIFVFILGQIRLMPREIALSNGSFFKQMVEGFKYILQAPTIRMVMLVLLFGGIVVRSVLELVPAVAAKTFADAPTGLAVLTGAAAVGAVISGLTVRSGNSRQLLSSVMTWWGIGAIASVGLVYAPHALLAMIAAMVVGASITRGLVSTQTFVQLATPDELRGRTLSLHGLIARASPAIGALAIGYAADMVGLAFSVTTASGLLIVYLATAFTIIRRRNRRVRCLKA